MSTSHLPIEDLHPLEHKIIACLKEVAAGKPEGTKDWTSEIKEGLSALADQLAQSGQKNLKAYFSNGKDADVNEWLYDLIWIEIDRPGQNDWQTRDLILAVESEWSLTWAGIKYDFEKLLVCNAHYRLMICESANPTGLIKKFSQSIAAYKSLPQGARFLIAIWVDGEPPFQFYLLQKG